MRQRIGTIIGSLWIAIATMIQAETSPIPESPGIRRSVIQAKIPKLQALNQRNERVQLDSVLSDTRPIYLQFIFTTCPTICPTLSAAFAGAQERLGPSARFVSISIDPEHDTPSKLSDYAQRFNARFGWTFLTGSQSEMAEIQKAFGVYQGNKMWHLPLTFVRIPRTNDEWIRIDGMASVDQLCEATAFYRKRLRDGHRLYNHGMKPNGDPVSAQLSNGVAVQGESFACATCHRPSGFGESEGAVQSPPITGPILFEGRDRDRGERLRELFQEPRPNHARAESRNIETAETYTLETLHATLTNGVAPSGRALNPIMPLYDFDKSDLQALYAYLQTLGGPDPGVTNTDLYLAVVFDETMDPTRKQAILDVAQAYVRRKNADTAAKLARPNFSPGFKSSQSQSYRIWNLQVWDLEGPINSYDAQLERRYAQRPVFAVIGGATNGPWRPIQNFLKRYELPCLFPLTNFPATADPNHSTLYFSRGLFGEGAALGDHLNKTWAANPSIHLIQYVDHSPESQSLRDGFETFFDGTLETRTWSGVLELTPNQPAVLWIGRDALQSIESESSNPIFTSATLAGSDPEDLPESIRLVSAESLSDQGASQTYRARAWIRSRRIRMTHERDQLLTWFTWNLFDHSLTHLVDHFSRDYLIEAVEHETENRNAPEIFPRLSLGPGQRVAARAYHLCAPGNPLHKSGPSHSEWWVPDFAKDAN